MASHRADDFRHKLDRTLCDLDFSKGAACKIEAGYLWIRHRPTRPWIKAERIPLGLEDIANEYLREPEDACPACGQDRHGIAWCRRCGFEEPEA